MRPLTLQSRITLNYTLVPDYFLDNYMPKASGEFVKIYLYILRCLGSGSPAMSCDVLKNGCAAYSGSDDCFCVSFLADRLNLTENDVMRALKYWENEGLLILTYENGVSSNAVSDGELTGITLADITSAATDDGSDMQAYPCGAGTSDSYTVSEQAAATVDTISSKPAAAAELSPKAQTVIPEKPSYTAAQLKEFAANEELSQLLYIAQMYLGKTLTATDTNSMIFFYDTLKMSADVIEYLLEYCISKDHRSMRYIEKVAIDWTEHGISTVKAAREYSESKSEDMFAVMNAFGITGRSAAKVERDYIRKWREVYGFGNDIIIEACNRTIKATHQPSFEYADSILTQWNERRIKSVDDIKALDAEYDKARKASIAAATGNSAGQASRSKSAGNNRFNNFSQRDYNYDELETQFVSRELV